MNSLFFYYTSANTSMKWYHSYLIKIKLFFNFNSFPISCKYIFHQPVQTVSSCIKTVYYKNFYFSIFIHFLSNIFYHYFLFFLNIFLIQILHKKQNSDFTLRFVFYLYYLNTLKKNLKKRQFHYNISHSVFYF